MNWTFRETRALYEAAGEKPRMSKAVVRAVRRHGHEADVVDKIARLQRFVGSVTGKPFMWGRRDCALSLADWLVANGYADPATDLRGAYATQGQCGALLAARGGLVAVVDDCARRAGLSAALEPRFGAVAVIGAASHPARQWGAIWDGGRWLRLMQDFDTEGCVFMPITARPLTMWAI